MEPPRLAGGERRTPRGELIKECNKEQTIIDEDCVTKLKE